MIETFSFTQQGRKPYSLQASSKLYRRSRLLSRVETANHSGIVIAGPAGYGKTVLAYHLLKQKGAQTSCLWIDCATFDFQKLLSNRAYLYQAVLTKTYHVIVFDGFNTDEADICNTLVYYLKTLQSYGIEVIVTTRLYHLEDYLTDYLCIGAEELLLSDAEFDRLGIPLSSRLPEKRIPTVCFCPHEGRSEFFSQVVRRPITDYASFLEKLLIALGRGSFSSLACFFGKETEERLFTLQKRYPHCGLDFSKKVFCAPRASSLQRFTLLKAAVQHCGQYSLLCDEIRFIGGVLDVLMETNQYVFASELARKTKDQGCIVQFLESGQHCLFEKGHFSQIENLSSIVDGEMFSRVVLMRLLQIKVFFSEEKEVITCREALIGSLFTGEKTRFVHDYPRRIAFASFRLLVLAFESLCYIRFASRGKKRHYERFLETMSLCYQITESASFADAARIRALLSNPETYLEGLCSFVFLAAVRKQSARVFLEELVEASYDGRVVLELLSYYLLLRSALFSEDGEERFIENVFLDEEAFLETGVDDTTLNELPPDLNCSHNLDNASEIEALLRKVLIARMAPEKGKWPLFVYDAFILEDLERSFPSLLEISEFAHYADAAREMNVYLQKQKRERIERKAGLSPVPLMGRQEENLVGKPHLYLSVLGGFSAEVVVEEQRFPVAIRSKGQEFLAILAANQGSAVSRTRIENALWPESTSSRARQSFYTLTNTVSKSFGVYAENVKFFETRYNAVYMRKNLVKTDLEELDTLCQTFQVGSLGYEKCQEFYIQLKKLYKGPILPGHDLEEIKAYRQSYANKIITALLKGQKELVKLEELHLALNYLEFAFEINPGREDVCYELMTVQYRLGQNQAALETFRVCRSYLTSVLGLPAPQRLSLLNNKIFHDMQTVKR
ncbi:MAG: BTAD domain-containing putative transcriptional regulator [Anaerotardibacter sp.]